MSAPAAINAPMPPPPTLDAKAWVLMDYADVIVHVFQDEVRRHYDLERLWSDAPQLGLGLASGAAHHGTVSR